MADRYRYCGNINCQNTNCVSERKRERDDNMKTTETTSVKRTTRKHRVIGVEVRLVDPNTGLQTELGILPLNVKLPRRTDGMRWEMNATIHTSLGDVNTGQIVLNADDRVLS